MKSKQEGFLALEAVVALAIVCIALTAMVTCLSGLKKLEQESSQRANQALAYRMLKECPVKRVKVRDHESCQCRASSDRPPNPGAAQDHSGID